MFSDIRKEHGAFLYKYEPCNVGNIRKMIIIYPQIVCKRIGAKENSVAMTNDPGGNNVYGNNLYDSRNERLDAGDSKGTPDDATSSIAPSQYVKGLGVKGNRDYYGREIPDSLKYNYSYLDWRPTSDRETLLACYDKEKGKNRKMKIFVDNPP